MGSSSLSRIKQSTTHFFKNKQSQRIIISFCIIAAGLVIFFNQNKIKTFLSKGADPVAYWKLDEGSGSTTYDSTGINTGTLASGVSAPLWTSTDQCVSGRCLFFDGTNDYVTLGTGLSSNTSNLGSISLWFRSTRAVLNSAGMMFYASNSGYPVGDGFGGDFELHVSLNASKQVNFYIEGFGGTDVNITSTAAYTDNKWHHVTATWDKAGSGFAYLYVDGISVGSGSMSGITSYTLGANAYLGRTGAADNYRMFGGYLDEVKFYSYARSAAEVKTDAVGGKGKAGDSAVLGAAGDPGTLSNGLVGYWKMNEVGVSGPNWTVIDSSGNNNNGVGAGNASVGSTAPGKFGNAGFFDGGGDWVDLTNSINLSTVHTLSFWLKYWNASDAVVLGNVNAQYGTYIDGPSSGGAIYYRPDPASSYVSVVHGGLTQGTWYHFTIVRNGRDVSFYKNGVKLGTTQTLDSNYDLVVDCFGANCNSNGFPFYGLLDEIRFYNRVFDQSAINTLYDWAPGPVAYWKMDERSGTTISDVSGNSYTGTFGTGNSAPSWNTGKFGNGLQFDGTNDYITIGDDNTLIQTGPLTLSAWIKTSDSVSNHHIVSKYRAVFGQRGYALMVADGKLRLELGNADDNATSVTSNTTVATGSWVHVAGVIGEDNVMRLYVNGVQDITATYTGTRQSATNEVQIGAYGDSDLRNSFFNGLIDEVKIYDYARTSSQIAEDINAGHPVVGTPVGAAILQYKMDEGFGTTVNDWSPQNNDGTLGTGNSAPTWTSDGKFNKALLFDGSNDIISFQSIGTSPPLTVSFWAKPTLLANWKILSTHCSGLQVYMYNSQWNIDHCGEAATAAAADATLNQWQHVIVVSENYSSRKIYINGVLKDTNTTTASTTTNWTQLGTPTTPIYTGYKGYLDDFKIYNFAFTANQAKLEYNQGKSLVLGSKSTASDGTTPDNSSARELCVPGDTSTCSAPVGEWNFDEKSGTSVNDSSGNGRTGTFGTGGSAPTWVTGKQGNGVRLFGSQYVDTATQFSFNTSTSFTLSGWFKFDATTDAWLIDRSTPTDELIAFLLSSNNISFRIRDDNKIPDNTDWVTASDTITTNQWYHFVGVRNVTDDTISIYVNGQLRGSNTDDTENTISPVVKLGSHYSSAGMYGTMDNVKLYDYARTPAQIAWEYNRGAPVAWYKMNEGTGTSVGDWAPNANGGFNGNSGTLGTGSSAPTWSTSGKYGSALSFDGTNDYVSVSDNSFLDFTGDFSVSVWVNPTSTSATSSIINKDTVTSERSYVLGIDSLGRPYGYVFKSDFTYTQFRTSSVTVPTSTWTHLVYVYNQVADQITVYVNGVSAGIFYVINTAGAVNSTSAPLWIGGRDYPASPAFFAGKLDDVKLFNYALTSAQAKSEMNSGALRYE